VVLLCASMALYSLEVNAANVYACTGKVDGINQAYDGTVSLYSSAIYGNSVGHTVCNLTTTWKGVTSDTCKGWLAKMFLAQAQGTNITVQYNDNYTACSQQPSFADASNPWAMW